MRELLNQLSYGMTTPVALAAVALIGYFVGRQSRERSKQTNNKQSAVVALRELETMTRLVRSELSTYLENVKEFEGRLGELEEDTSLALRDELNGIVAPTRELVTRIGQAYDELREQTGLLMSLADLRTDPRTGISLRHVLDETLDRLLSLMSRYDKGFSLVLLQVKPGYGEDTQVSDKVLRQAAKTIIQVSRDSDIVTHYGEDGFAVLLPETELTNACRFTERLNNQAKQNLRLQLAFGAAAALDGDNAKTILARVESALTAAMTTEDGFVYQHTGGRIELAPLTNRAQTVIETASSEPAPEAVRVSVPELEPSVSSTNSAGPALT